MIEKLTRYDYFQGSNPFYDVLFELYNGYWPWNQQVEEVKYKLRERKREERKAPRSNAKPKQKIKLTKLKRTQ